MWALIPPSICLNVSLVQFLLVQLTSLTDEPILKRFDIVAVNNLRILKILKIILVTNVSKLRIQGR